MELLVLGSPVVTGRIFLVIGWLISSVVGIILRLDEGGNQLFHPEVLLLGDLCIEGTQLFLLFLVVAIH